MPRYLQYSFAAVIAALLVAGPFAYAKHRQSRCRNFHVVRDGVLYRSGQSSVPGLKRLVHDYGIKTVVTLRAAQRAGDPAPDKAEEDWCISQELNYIRIPQIAWEAPDGSIPNAKGVEKFLEIMKNPDNHPVLVHCLAGKHRTGTYCAIYHMEFDRWTNQQAIDDMKWYGYDNVQEHLDVLSYLENYRPAWAKGGELLEPATDHTSVKPRK